MPIQNLKRFYVKYYQPDNAMLVVAGKFDEAQALALIQKYFGAMPKPERTLDKTYTEEPPQDGERLVMLRRVGDVALVAAAYHVPSGGHPDIAALEVLGYVLDTPPSGRLYQALVEARKATRVSAGASSWHDPGVFQVQAEVRKEDSLDEAKEILLEVTENIGQQRVSEEEVARARQRILKQRELAAANTSSIAVQLSNWASQGDWRLYFLHRDRIEEVTPSDVERVAASYLRRNNRTLGMFVPSESTERVGVPATPDLAELLAGYTGREQVAAGEAFEVSPQNIEQRSHRFTVADGIEAVFLPKKTRGEAVHARVVLRYGALESLKGYQAAAELLPPLMLRGTKQLSRQQIQDELDRLRATLTASGETGAATFSLQTTRANLPAVLELLRQIVREPSLPRNEFEVLARQQLAGLEEQLTDPQSLAIVDVRRKVSPYSQDDVRYVPTIVEEIARVKALTLEQMKQLYEDYFGSQAGEVAVVGDFDPDQNKAVLEETFGGWTSEQPYQRIPKVAFTDVPGGRSRIQTPDKANATYVAGLAFAMSDTDPEYPAMVLGNFVLGGGSLSSRLGDRVRQKEGLSYGV
ncbi:MAG: insulinase family protein, partial [Pirellulales bacterium]